MRHEQPESSRESRGSRREDDDRRSRSGRDDGRFRSREDDDDRDWNERGGRSFGSREDESRDFDEPGYGGRSQGYGGQGQRQGQQSYEGYGNQGQMGQAQYGQGGGRGFGQGYGGQMGQGQMGQGQMGQGQFGGQRQMSGWGEGYYDYGHPSYQGQGGRGQFGGHEGEYGGQGQYGGQGRFGGRDYGRQSGGFGGYGQGSQDWISQPGRGGGDYGSSNFEEERGRSHRGISRSRGQEGRSPMRGKGPKGYTRSDERIQEEVCELLSDADIDASEITVKVENGEVTLEGTVSNRWEKREAEDVVCEARGVRDCRNHLKISSQQSQQEQGEGTQQQSRQSNGGRVGTSVASKSSGAMSS